MQRTKAFRSRRRLLGGTFRQGAIVLLSLALLTACASTSTASRDKAIEQRAQARWDALLAGDYATAWSYLSPGYRSALSVTDYEISMRTRRVQYTSAEYQSHTCEEAACTVQVMVGYRVVKPAQGVPEWNSKSAVEERWIQLDGKWWFLPES